jgi:GntR family transcriptional regulator
VPTHRRRFSCSGVGSLEPWEAACEKQDRNGELEPVQVDRSPATAELAHRLDVKPGTERVRRSRRMSLDGGVAQFQDSWMPASLVDGTPVVDPATWEGGVYAAMWQSRLMPAFAAEEVTARLATSEESQRLQIDGGVPVLVAWRTVWDLRDRPVEARRIVAVGGRVTFAYGGLRVDRPVHLWSLDRITATLANLRPWRRQR